MQKGSFKTIDRRFHVHPLSSQGQALIFPHQRLRGVCIENKRICGWDFTPILAFPHQGGRDFAYIFTWHGVLFRMVSRGAPYCAVVRQAGSTDSPV